MTELSASFSKIVSVTCRCGRSYPFWATSRARKISNKEKLKAGWRSVKIKFLFLFFKKIMICPTCAIEKNFPDS